MEQFSEFVANNLLLWIAFLVVLMLTIRAEYLHQSNSANQLSPLNATRMMNNEDPLILDVSPEEEFSKSHIKGSINIPMPSLSDKISELEKYKDKTIVACCRHGNQSNKACRTLKKSGFSKVYNITGGLQNWTEASLPTVNSKNT